MPGPLERPRRLVQELRRKRLIRRLLQRRPVSLLFVCHANLCRSPYAARAMSRLLPRDLRTAIAIDSAGFAGPGKSPPPEAIAVASGRGVDLRSHRSRPLGPAAVRAADFVWVMEPSQQREVCSRYRRSSQRVLLLGDLDPRPSASRAIEDPFGKPREVYISSYERIDRCLAELARTVIGAPPHR